MKSGKAASPEGRDRLTKAGAAPASREKEYESRLLGEPTFFLLGQKWRASRAGQVTCRFRKVSWRYILTSVGLALPKGGLSLHDLARRDAKFFFKRPGEVFFIPKAYCGSNITHHAFAVFQHSMGAIQAVVTDKLGGVFVGQGF